jgi:serine/threonine protein kinase/tetratricopeptide (TPR) repeat protein
MVAPMDDNQATVVEEALTRFVDECLQGKSPDVDEFVEQYPQCEAQLKLRLQDLEQIDSLFDSLVRADEIEFAATAAGYDLSGRKIGSFEIVEMIGRGGMGIVYLARDTKLKRSVAIKSMPVELQANATARMRFRREAELLASLNHANIAVIYDIIEQDDGAGYLVLEYVPGQTLAQRIADKPLKLSEALSIGQQVAEAVSAAHDKGVIHRDLKPGNIKITPQENVKVLDFGLAKVSSTEVESAETGVTQPGRVIGTPAYMSPEQTRGKSTDHRTDIWSFGCLMYEMLSGQVPFEGQTATDTVARILEREPGWEALPQDTPTNIRTLLRRCLEKDLRRRLRDIGDAVIEIKETLNIPVTAPPVTTPSSTSLKPPIIARNKLRTMAMIVIAAIVIVLTVIAVQHISKKEVQPSLKEIRLVVLPFENLGSTEDEYFADGITDAITARLAGIHGLSVLSRQSAMQYKDREKSSKEIGEELGVDYILEGTVQRERPTDPTSRVRIIPQLINASEDAHVWTEIYDDDMNEVFRLQSDIAEHVAQALDITLIEPERRALASRPTENMEAYEYYLQGNNYLRGRVSLGSDCRIAIKMYERAIELDPGFALAYTELCGAHSRMYGLRYDHSQERIALAKQAVDEALQLDPDLPEVHLALGGYYGVTRDFERSLEQYAIVLKSRPNNTRAINMIGYRQRDLGKLEQAVTNWKRLLELHPRDARLLYHVGDTLACLRKYPEAERYYNRAIWLAPDRPGPYYEKAWLYLSWEGNTDKARAVLAEALQNFESTENPFVNGFVTLDVFDRNYQGALDRLSLKSEDISSVTRFIPTSLRYARIYGYMGKKELAKKYYDEARSIVEAKIEQDPEEARFHSSLGIAYAGLRRKEDAVREGKLAVEMHPVNREAMRRPYSVEDLARIYVMVGEYEEAIDQLEHLLSIPGRFSIHFLRLDPAWDPLRNHPRFKELIKPNK